MQSKYHKLPGNWREKEEDGKLESSQPVIGLQGNMRKIMTHQPYQVQLCLALAAFSLLISLFLDSRDVGKTAMFYFITHMACVFGDWNSQ